MAAEIPIYRKVQLPQILTPADISGYLAAFISSFSLFSLPRVEALLHVCRSVEIEHTQIDVEALPQLEPGYVSLRKTQDLLRYLLYEIEERCPEGGIVRPSSLDEFILAGLTARKFSEISRSARFGPYGTL